MLFVAFLEGGVTQSPLSPCRRGGGSAPIVPLQTLLEGGLKPIAPSSRPWRGELSFHGPPADAPGGRGTQPHCPPADGGNSAPLSPCRRPYGGNSVPIVPLQTPQREMKSAPIVPCRRGDSAPIVPCRRGDSTPIVPLQTLLEGGGLGPHCPPADGWGGNQSPLSPCRRSWREGGSALIVHLQTGEGDSAPIVPLQTLRKIVNYWGELRFRVTHKEWDCKDDLKLFKYDNPKFKLSFLPWMCI